MTARVRSAKPKGPLERLAERLAGDEALQGRSLGALWQGLLLRAGAQTLLERANLPLPSDARLFANSAAEAPFEAIASSSAYSEIVREATGALLTELGAATEDLPHAFGALFEALQSFEVTTEGSTLATMRRRKRTGTFFTPAAIARQVAERALDELQALGTLRAEARDALPRIHDPACGGGAFLIEAARALIARSVSEPSADEHELRRRVVCEALSGTDLNPLAVAVAELALWVVIGDPRLPAAAVGGLHERDALLRSPEGAAERFELVIGNPPWVAFAGRAAQPLPPARRAYYSREYVSFHGYPTLQAMFVERALELAPQGLIALLVPSPLADLDGYRAMRRRLFATHEPCEPLLEFGQDAFSFVTQPCFALVARARSHPAAPEDARSFVLCERSRLGTEARTVAAPAALSRLFEREPFPPELFGELGFQSNRRVTEQLLFRGEAPSGAFAYPLLEGRDVREFRVGAPRLFLRPDIELLRSTGCRLRELGDYQRARFVVRQTARAPIAALHNGMPFRNSLLAGFEVSEYPPELVVGLLNSSLYRALHLARQRDARQHVFPQVKVGHLRSLPRPPGETSGFGRIIACTQQATASAPAPELRRALDDAVFDLFELTPDERREIVEFLRERAPELVL